MSKTIYTAHAKALGGRNGTAETDDGTLKLTLAIPGSPTVKPGSTNPEQLFACGYAACFASALDFVARQRKIDIGTAEVKSDVSLNQDENGFAISVVLNINLPTLGSKEAEELVEAAHGVCPYSKATRGNIEVTLKVNDQPLSKAA